MTHSEISAEYYDDDHGLSQRMGKKNRGHREDARRLAKRKHMSRKDAKQMDQFKSFSHGK